AERFSSQRARVLITKTRAAIRRDHRRANAEYPGSLQEEARGLAGVQCWSFPAWLLQGVDATVLRRKHARAPRAPIPNGLERPWSVRIFLAQSSSRTRICRSARGSTPRRSGRTQTAASRERQKPATKRAAPRRPAVHQRTAKAATRAVAAPSEPCPRGSCGCGRCDRAR